MKKALRFLRILVLVSLAVILVIPSTILAATFIADSFYISAQSEEEVSPSIAYNSQRQEYLVVWYNDRTGCDDIRAQRLTKNGTLIGGPFYISANAGCPTSVDKRYPDVAYDSTADQYLVVWEEYAASTHYSIKGRRVSGNGALIDDLADLTIRAAGAPTYDPAKPAVAYSSTSDRYMVVYEEAWHPGPVWNIYGQMVVPSSGLTEGGQINIAQNASGPLQEADVAYNSHSNSYLVAWQQKPGGDWDVFGQQVQGNGSLSGGSIILGYYTVDDKYPAVAALPDSPTDNKFLVVWELYANSIDHDIYGILVAEDGTVGTDFGIATYGVNEASPAIAGNNDNLQYFVTWRYDHSGTFKPIRGQAVTYAGVLTGQLQQALPTDSDADNPAVAAGPVGDFLVAWQDLRDTPSENIYGRLYGNRTYLPLVVRP